MVKGVDETLGDMNYWWPGQCWINWGILEAFSNPNDSVWCRKAGRSPGTQKVAPCVCQDPATFPQNENVLLGSETPTKHTKKITICDAICVCSVAQQGQAVPRLLSTYARELKEVHEPSSSFSPPGRGMSCFSWEQHISLASLSLEALISFPTAAL